MVCCLVGLLPFPVDGRWWERKRERIAFESHVLPEADIDTTCIAYFPKVVLVIFKAPCTRHAHCDPHCVGELLVADQSPWIKAVLSQGVVLSERFSWHENVPVLDAHGREKNTGSHLPPAWYTAHTAHCCIAYVPQFEVVTEIKSSLFVSFIIELACFKHAHFWSRNKEDTMLPNVS